MTFAGVHMLLNMPNNAWLQSMLAGINLAALADSSILSFLSNSTAILAIVSGAIGLYYMVRCYLIPARPFWNHWQTATSFIGNSISLGGLMLTVLVIATLTFSGSSISTALSIGGAIILLGLISEAIGLSAHAKSMRDASHEGAASFYIQTTTFGKTYLLRNVLLGFNIVLIIGLLIAQSNSILALALWILSATLLITTSVISRALFYVLVVPTTMPGAFFWKNKGFEEHAKDIGLAASMPSAGIVDSGH